MPQSTQDILTDISKKLDELSEMKVALIDFLGENLPDASGLSSNEVMLQDSEWQQSPARAEEKRRKAKLLEELEGVRRKIREAEGGSPTTEQGPALRFLLSQSYFIEGDLQWLYVVANSDHGCSFPRDPAISAFRSALAALGDPPIKPEAAAIVQDSLGRALRSDGRYSEAIAAFKAAVALAPGSESAAEAAEEIPKTEMLRDRAASPPRLASPPSAPQSSSACVIATACLGGEVAKVASLRHLRDEAIMSDPIARDFFHVFWSRYYEWSPAVARLAEQDPGVARHIRWSFLDPWLAWMELTARVGNRSFDDLTPEERDTVLRTIVSQLQLWIAELPTNMEGKCPSDPAEVFRSFERFRAKTLKVFGG